MNTPLKNCSTHFGQSFNITDHRLRDSLHINCSAEIQLENTLTKPLELKCQLSSTQLKIISMNGENLKKLNRMVKKVHTYRCFTENHRIWNKIRMNKQQSISTFVSWEISVASKLYLLSYKSCSAYVDSRPN